jgi:hypothetical protein
LFVNRALGTAVFYNDESPLEDEEPRMTGNEYVELLRTSLTRFRDEAAEFVQSHGTDPAAGSIAATERSSFARPESLLSAAAIAAVLVESVSEHLTAFVKTITEPVEPIACWTCVRSMLESASIAAWLLEPGIGAQERVGRVFALRYEGMEQELKFLNAAGVPAADVKKLEDHIDDVEKIALGLGFSQKTTRKGERIGIAKQMPSATDIIKQVLGEDLAYRMLSAVAHGHFWAIHQLSFSKGQPGVADGVAVVELMKSSGTLQGYAFLGLRAMKSLALPLWNQCLYYGWDKDRLTKLLESVYDEIKATDAIRFWR